MPSRPVASTSKLYQQILQPPSRRQEPPPRILHSQAHTTLDPLILDLISLICREHVLVWYNDISQDPDRTFINQVASIVIHVIQALEVRLASVDLVELVLIEIPSILERHYQDYDQAEERSNTGYAHNLDVDHVLHLLQPHIAVSLATSPSGEISPEVDKIYLRALVDNLLRLLLPLEDYRAETERAIVKEIIVNIIFGSVFDKVAQPWFLHQMIAKILETKEVEDNDRLRQRVETLQKVPSEPAAPTQSNFLNSSMTSTFDSMLTILQNSFRSVSLLYQSITSSTLPPAYKNSSPISTPILSLLLAVLPPTALLSQSIHYLQLPLSLTSSFINSLLYYSLNTKIFTPDLVKTLLEVTTKSLFPGGHPSPKEPDPTGPEKEEWRIRCENAVARSIPRKCITLLDCTRIQF